MIRKIIDFKLKIILHNTLLSIRQVNRKNSLSKVLYTCGQYVIQSFYL